MLSTTPRRKGGGTQTRTIIFFFCYRNTQNTPNNIGRERQREEKVEQNVRGSRILDFGRGHNDGDIVHGEQQATHKGDRTRRLSPRLRNPRHPHRFPHGLQPCRRRHCSRAILCNTGHAPVHTGILLYADCILCLQGIQRLLFL